MLCLVPPEMFLHRVPLTPRPELSIGTATLVAVRQAGLVSCDCHLGR